MKDSFDLRQFLVENKMTEASRGEVRKHFNKVTLNENVHIPADPDAQLDEAGYTSDDDYVDDDFSATGTDADLGIEDDPRARKAARRAMKGTDLDADAPEEVEPIDDAPVGDEDDEEAFEAPEDINNDTVSGGEHFDINYDPETVEMEMEGDELDAYLNHFRRPAVAAKVLQRALKMAQAEVDESPMFRKKPIYLVLSNGFYKTVTFLTSGSGQKLIAKIYRHSDADNSMEECDYMDDKSFDAALEEALKKIK